MHNSEKNENRYFSPVSLNHSNSKFTIKTAVFTLALTVFPHLIEAQFIYNAQFGSSGSGLGQFSQPNGIAVNPSNDNVYVTDRNNERVQVFNTSGTFQFQFGSLGAGNGQFASNNGAIDLDFDGSGNVWVVDRGNSRVQQFTAAGAYVSQFGSAGSAAGQFSQPNGIAVHPTNGNVYVADRNNERIQVFNSAGAFQFQFGTIGAGNGQFASNNGAVALAFDTNTGNLWVVDRGNSRVQEFTDAGVYQSQFGSAGAGSGQFSQPNGIEFNPVTNHVYIADRNNERIQVFNTSGVFQYQFGSLGSGNGQFASNNGVVDMALGTSNGDLWVIDRGNSRVQHFQDPVILPVELINFRYEIDENLRVKLLWETISELNNSHFIVQSTSASSPGLWNDLAKIDGAGNSNTIRNYDWLNSERNALHNFYRLKQVDFDGNFSFSQIVTIAPSAINDFVRIYPNPTSDFLHFDLKLAERSASNLYQIAIYDLQGRLMIRHQVKPDYDRIQAKVPVSDLIDGSYRIVLENNDEKILPIGTFFKIH